MFQRHALYIFIQLLLQENSNFIFSRVSKEITLHIQQNRFLLQMCIIIFFPLYYLLLLLNQSKVFFLYFKQATEIIVVEEL